MIRINLLPHHLRPIKRTALPHVISVAVMMIVLLCMANLYLGKYSERAQANREIDKLRKEMASLKDVVDEHNSLTDQKKQLQDRIGIIQGILKDRTLWSEWLAELMRLTPDNIWYSKIQLTSRKFPEEKVALNKKGQPDIDPKTKKVKMERIQVERLVLQVSGYATQDESGMSSTSTLANNTNTDEKFTKKFSLFTSKIEDTDFNKFAVRGFTFEYLILP